MNNVTTIKASIKSHKKTAQSRAVFLTCKLNLFNKNVGCKACKACSKQEICKSGNF